VNLLGRAAPAFMRGLVRKRALDMLFARTAAAFGQQMPRLRGLSADATLQAFAAFTAQAAAEAARSTPCELAIVQRRLFEVAYEPGRWLRRVFGVSSASDSMAVGRLAYRLLDIDFRGDAQGAITINRCSFSDVYSPAVCRVMSALDAGLLAGLSGGERLVLSERITEGYPCCRGRLLSPEPAV
jgi:hypothetical protein